MTLFRYDQGNICPAYPIDFLNLLDNSGFSLFESASLVPSDPLLVSHGYQDAPAYQLEAVGGLSNPMEFEYTTRHLRVRKNKPGTSTI